METTGESKVQFRNPVKQLGFAMLDHAVGMDAELSDGAYRTLAALIRYAQQSDDCWVSRARLALERGKSEATISRHLSELVRLGYITRERRAQGQTSMTYIEDWQGDPRLQELAVSFLRRRKNATTDVAKMRPQTSHFCDVEEELLEEEPKKKKDVLDLLLDFADIDEGDNYAVHAEAGGTDDYASCVRAFADLVGVNYADLQPRTFQEWARRLRRVAETWAVGPDLLKTAIIKLPESKFHWKTYATPRHAEDDLGTLLGQLLKNGRVEPPRKKDSRGLEHLRRAKRTITVDVAGGVL